MSQEVMIFISKPFSRNFIIRNGPGSQIGRIEYRSIRNDATIRYLDDLRYCSRPRLSLFRLRMDLIDEWKEREDVPEAEKVIAFAKRLNLEQMEVHAPDGVFHLLADSRLSGLANFHMIESWETANERNLGTIKRSPEGFILTCDSSVSEQMRLFCFTLAIHQIRSLEASN